jgi:NADH:ubiquinone oxidoreductase subunit 4 (subunit M)
MLLLSTLCIPFIAAIILLFVKHNEKANYVAIVCSGVTMALVLLLMEQRVLMRIGF